MQFRCATAYGVDYWGIPYGGTSYEIVVCKGCKTKSFRISKYKQKSHHKPSPNDDDTFSYEYELYPKDILWHKNDLREHEKHIPVNIYQIYYEVLSAIQEEAYILAAVGFRAIIEGICNDLEIAGGLLNQIDKLYEKLYISDIDADRLHQLRFLGNDVVHELSKPTELEIRWALEITERLIEFTYIVDKKSETTIEPPIRDYDKFKDCLAEKIDASEVGTEKNLKDWLGQDRRFLDADLKRNYEPRLIGEIKHGEFNELELVPLNEESPKPQRYKKRIE